MAQPSAEVAKTHRLNCPMGCQAWFEDPEDQRQHLSDRHGVRTLGGFIPCRRSGCGYLFTTRSARNTHEEHDHGSGLVPIGADTDQSTPKPIAVVPDTTDGIGEGGSMPASKTFSCPECGRDFPSAQGRALHRTRAHASGAQTTKPKRKRPVDRAGAGRGRAPTKQAPARSAPATNGHHAGGLVTVRLYPEDLETILEAIGSVDVNMSDVDSIEAGAQRLGLIARLRRAAV